MVKLFDIAYHLGKNELPFSLFPAIVNLEKRRAVDLGSTYSNSIQAKVFSQYIAEDIRQSNVSKLTASRYISILVDGSTDRSQKEKELLYAKFLDDGVPRMCYVGYVHIFIRIKKKNQICNNMI